MRIFFRAAVLVLIFCIFTPAAFVASEINITIDGVPVDFDNRPPAIVEGRALVPLRSVFEHLGFDVDWDQYAMTAVLTREDIKIVITIGSDIFSVNDIRFLLDVPAQIIDGRVMLPIRRVLERLGYSLYWNDETRTVEISTARQQSAIVHTVSSESISVYPLLSADEFEQLIFELINAERINHDLEPLTWDDRIADAARAHSQDMAANSFMDHIGSDGSNARARMDKFDVPAGRSGENLFRGTHRRWSPEEIVEWWMISIGHRGNILNPSFRMAGVGFTENPELGLEQGRYRTTIKFLDYSPN